MGLFLDEAICRAMLANDKKQSVYQALCQLLGGQPEDADRPGIPQEEWPCLAKLAREEGVAPLLFWKLSRRQGWETAIPRQARSMLEEEYYRSAAFNLLLFQELERVRQALSAAGIGFVVLKGAALARLLYPDVASRPMVDLDLLVNKVEIEQCASLLRPLGYEKSYEEVVPWFASTIGHHTLLRNRLAPNLAIELHWSLVAGPFDWRTPDAGWFFRQAVEMGAGGRSGMRTLSPGAHLLYLAAHLILQHPEASSRLLWLYDIHLAVTAWKEILDWDELLERAIHFRWVAALEAALRGAQDCFGTPLPEGFLDALVRSGEQRTLRLVRLPTGVSPRQRVIWENFAALNALGRLLLGLAYLFPSPAYLRQRFAGQPSRPWPFFYFLYWLRALQEIARGIRKDWKRTTNPFKE